MTSETPLRYDRVKWTLLVTLLFSIGAPLVPRVALHPIVVATVLLGILATFAAWKRAWCDVGIMMIIVATLLAAQQIFPRVDEPLLFLRVCALLALFFLHITLLIGPWSRFFPRVRKWYRYRRHLGVTTFLLGLAHASFVMNIYFGYSFQSAYTTSFTFFGATTLYILFLLAATSWDIVQKKIPLRAWNAVHAFTFMLYAAAVWFFSRVTLGATNTTYFLLGVFIIYWFLVAPWSLPRFTMRRINGWKQLHMLAYGAYGSLLVHTWTGTIQYQSQGIRILFWSMAMVVAGSHAAGLLVQFQTYRKRRASPSPQTVQRDGKTFYHVGTMQEFEEGKGRRVDVAGKLIAIFREGETFFALSALCPHQNGPLEQGKIVNGYVVCPWHGYQWSTKDGNGPPGYGDCVPAYPVIVEHNEVYVAPQCRNHCDC